MLERFSPEARQVVALAQDQARGMGHSHVGTEHLLLGLIGEETGAAGRAFATLGVTLDGARDAVMALVHRRRADPSRAADSLQPARQGHARGVAAPGHGLQGHLDRHRAHPARAADRARRPHGERVRLARVPAGPAAHDRASRSAARRPRPTRTTTATRCSCSPRARGSRDGRCRRSASPPRRCARRSSGRAAARNPHARRGT